MENRRVYKKLTINWIHVFVPIHTGQPPSDRSNPENITTPTELVIAMNIFVGMGIVLCLVVLVFNTVTIRKPLVDYVCNMS